MRCGAWCTDLDTLTNIEPTLAGIKRTRIFQVHRWTHRKLELRSSKAQFTLDFTRAGKRMPDALSQTVPIWCAVINRAVLKTAPNINVDADAWNTKVHTPPGVVGAQEHDQGSGDDHKLWSMDLTPAQFWKHKQTLLRENLIYLTSADRAPPTLKDYSRVRVDVSIHVFESEHHSQHYISSVHTTPPLQHPPVTSQPASQHYTLDGHPTLPLQHPPAPTQPARDQPRKNWPIPAVQLRA
ncbi:initiator tRNA phosphoribosyl transferase-domain-containing protein [Suillus fuscotomentosus]|uniref:Initiator tRNA phosphoribosyl transferase-domain-containing protein n=1 Tax=Suillus fuscotomentosus TaxID=1912939 RepID=A0AAD4EBY0_9AGAM|nr:initiator tRNA phosphoribosyl transferase-domain-containing protein [Suillus fuscotomentosus]KAG1903322.1 initiator tRNA phosphoribosyl transferase-domain-containing protein [Suillus fuscotomentosus]